MPTSFTKDPRAVLDYLFDWSGWLAPAETITASTMTVDPAGLTVQSASFTATTATVWLTGGTLGARHAVTNHVTTSAGRQDDRTIQVTIRDR